MKLTTLVMLIGSAGFLILGLVLLFSSKLKNKIKNSGIMKNPEGYIKFNGSFNSFIGIIGFILSCLDAFIPSYSKVFVILFIVSMFTASISQAIIGRKYR